MRRVTHLRRVGSELTGCGQQGPYIHKTFETAAVTCTQCRVRCKEKFSAPAPIPKTVGRVVQPGGGHRR